MTHKLILISACDLSFDFGDVVSVCGKWWNFDSIERVVDTNGGSSATLFLAQDRTDLWRLLALNIR